MLTTFALTSLLAFAPGAAPVCIEAPVPVGPTVFAASATDDALRALYEKGVNYADFMDSATRRKALWEHNTEVSAGLDMALVERARAVGGTWRFLVVAVDSCSDSVNTVPHLARLVSLVDGLDMRIVDSTVGREVMDAHKTPDGRGSTPTMVLLDDEWNEAGCFIERPMHLQDWIAENDGTLSRDAIFEGKMEWYQTDAGGQTVEEFVTMLESASRGDSVCQGS